MQAKLVYSTKWFPKSQTISVWEPDSSEKLLRCIFGNLRLKNLQISNNRYYYKPSDEYKSVMIRFKGVRK